MEKDEEYKSVYVGFEVNVQHLQSVLEESGIDSRIKNDYQSGLRAGFAAELQGQAQLMVDIEDYAAAKRIAEETFPADEEE
ncbi:MAG TPA: DUF2007 domain-containing protein [Flavobacteriaceae bacterium]|nr:DUF2007 domain-containing protein [Flavobacteriaceae bacterium]